MTLLRPLPAWQKYFTHRLSTYVIIPQFDESLNAEDEWAAGTIPRSGISSNATYILDEGFLIS
jgi:hypothetical protein